MDRTILVVDADDTVRRKVVLAFEDHGYRTLEARSRDEALGLSLAQQGYVHLVLCDAENPGKSFALEARQSSELSLFMLGIQTDHGGVAMTLVERALRAGAHDWALLEPREFLDLLDSVEKLLDQKETQPSPLTRLWN